MPLLLALGMSSCRDDSSERPGGYDTVSALISGISADTMSRSMQELTSIPSRATADPGCLAARDYLIQQFTASGWNVTTQTFMVDGTQAYNVIAEKSGVDAPGSAVIVSAHYDSVGYPGAGANDDASGSAGLVAIAESLSAVQGGSPAFRHTIRLIAFSAEELGLLGSQHYVSTLDAGSVLAVLNLDGIAPAAANPHSLLLSYRGASSRALYDAFIRINDDYSEWTGFTGYAFYDDRRWGTDTDSFWSRGYSGLWILGDGDYPYANTALDTMDRADSAYGARVVQAVAAVAFTLAEPVGEAAR